jgi:hypothetical protein
MIPAFQRHINLQKQGVDMGVYIFSSSTILIFQNLGAVRHQLSLCGVK